MRIDLGLSHLNPRDRALTLCPRQGFHSEPIRHLSVELAGPRLEPLPCKLQRRRTYSAVIFRASNTSGVIAPVTGTLKAVWNCRRASLVPFSRPKCLDGSNFVCGSLDFLRLRGRVTSRNESPKSLQSYSSMKTLPGDRAPDKQQAGIRSQFHQNSA